MQGARSRVLAAMRAAERLEYQPALDGVRCFAVMAVLLFHAGTPGFSGGYLGVSVFFTLSGYLVTSLIVTEHDATATVDLATFYGRRVKRLLPASIATIAAVVVISSLFDVFDAVVGLRAQVVGALLQVSNWVLLAGNTSYQDLLAQGAGTASPLAHFWSLAIEEQFYWLWPPVIVLLSTRMKDRTTRVRVVGVITLVAMLAAPVIAYTWGPDAAYWATPARLGELLVGAFLAIVLKGVAVPGRVSLLAPLALMVLIGAVMTFPASSGPAYEGLLPLVAVVSASLILGLQADGPIRRALSAGPLVAVGRISYGLYLVHWPIFLIVDAERTGLDGAALTVVRLLITFVVAIASYLLLEQPIRLRQGTPARTTLGVGALVSLGLIGVAVVVVPVGSTEYWRVDSDAVDAAAIDVDSDVGDLTAPLAATAAANQSTESGDDTPTTVVAGTEADSTAMVPTSTTPARPNLMRPVRIIVTGDSTADALGTGVVHWAASHSELARAEVHAALGCGFVMDGERLWGDSIVSTASCDGWPESQLYPAVERARPDVVVVMSSVWDLVAQRWDGEHLLTPLDADYRARLVDAYTGLVDDASAAGATHVAFVLEPVPNVWWNDARDAEADPERHELLAEVYREVVAARPGTVEIVDLASWFSEQGLERDREVRPDGIHLAPDAATAIVEQFLSDRLIDIAIR